MRMRKVLPSIVAAVALLSSVSSVSAETLAERAAAGKPIRIGFSNEVPWAYPGDKNQPLGFANAEALGVLKTMGYTNIEPVVTDWGGLIPGLQAGRFDIITGGMYITGSRCKNVSFAEPMGRFGDAFIVKAGNPKALHTYKDIKDKGATLITVAGYVTVEAAAKAGVSAEHIVQVPSLTEVLAAVRTGRADAGGGNYFDVEQMVKNASGQVEATDPKAMPESLNWVAIAFKKEDSDFLSKFNAAQAKFLATPQMLSEVSKYGYTKENLPGDAKTDWICANR